MGRVKDRLKALVAPRKGGILGVGYDANMGVYCVNILYTSNNINSIPGSGPCHVVSMSGPTACMCCVRWFEEGFAPESQKVHVLKVGPAFVLQNQHPTQLCNIPHSRGTRVSMTGS